LGYRKDRSFGRGHRRRSQTSVIFATENKEWKLLLASLHGGLLRRIDSPGLGGAMKVSFLPAHQINYFTCYRAVATQTLQVTRHGYLSRSNSCRQGSVDELKPLVRIQTRIPNGLILFIVLQRFSMERIALNLGRTSSRHPDYTWSPCGILGLSVNPEPHGAYLRRPCTVLSRSNGERRMYEEEALEIFTPVVKIIATTEKQ
jgi:hypothetical protein